MQRVVTRWSSHSEAMLQAALDDVDWDMFRVSSSDVSVFTDVALSFVNTLTEQATETMTVTTFPNQKPWVDGTIRAAVNKCTAAYNEALLSGNMSEYKASCYFLRRAVRAAKLRYRERIESHFQLNDSRRMWQGLGTICAFGNKSSAEVRADPLLADELNTFYGRFELGMHRSDTQDRYRLRSGHFLRIGYRRDETDPNPILCVYYCVIVKPHESTKHYKAP